MMVVQESIDAMVAKLEAWFSGLIVGLPNFVVAVLVLTLFFYIAKKVRGFVFKRTHESNVKDTLTNLIATTTYIVIIIIGAYIALEILNLSTAVTSLLAGAGIIGLALAFAFQDIAANYISGVIMATREIFKINDLIQTNGNFGKVKKIGLRTTELELLEGQNALIPNSQILQNPLINYTQRGERRVDIACGVGYETDLDKAMKTAKKAAAKVKKLKKKKGVEVFYNTFNDSSIDFVVRFWIPFTNKQPDYLTAQSQAIMLIKKEFEKEGLNIPFPIRTLDVSDDILKKMNSK